MDHTPAGGGPAEVIYRTMAVLRSSDGLPATAGRSAVRRPATRQVRRQVGRSAAAGRSGPAAPPGGRRPQLRRCVGGHGRPQSAVRSVPDSTLPCDPAHPAARQAAMNSAGGRCALGSAAAALLLLVVYAALHTIEVSGASRRLEELMRAPPIRPGNDGRPL